MSHQTSYHHAASEQSHSYDILMPGTGNRYHRFETQQNDKQREKKGGGGGGGGAAAASTPGPSTWSVGRAIQTPMHIVDEPTATDRRREQVEVAQQKLVDVSSPSPQKVTQSHKKSSPNHFLREQEER